MFVFLGWEYNYSGVVATLKLDASSDQVVYFIKLKMNNQFKNYQVYIQGGVSNLKLSKSI